MSGELIKSPNYNDTSYLVKRLFVDHMKPYLPKVLMAVLCMVMVAATTSAMALIMQPILDEVFLDKNQGMLTLIVAAIIAIFVVKSLSLFGQNYIMGCLGQRIIADLQMLLYKHLLYSDLATVHNESSGQIISRFTNDIGTLRTSINLLMTSIARDSLMLIFLIGAMFYQSFTMAIIAFLAFPLAIWPLLRLGKRMRKISNSSQIEMGNFTARLDETFSGARIIKAYGKEEFEIKRASSKVDDIYKLFCKATRNKAASPPVMELIGGLAIAAVVWYGGMQVLEGHTTGGKFFSFITAALMTYRPAKSLSNMSTTLQEGLAAARRLFMLIDIKPQIIDKDGAKELVVTNKGASVEFDNVDFSYNIEKAALKNMSFIAEPGKTVALVGPSGGGKSTIMNLILRFYDTQNGSVKINGDDIRDIKIASLRDNIAFVSQDIALFDDTIAANIAYGDPSQKLDDIKKAAKAAAADEFIEELPKGYDSMIGQDGMTLSGGQRQRISIARAILKDAPILLLDEATSALDPISEKKIQAALQKLMKGRTTIVIAHRLSTIENADIIYVIKNGSIIESGTHNSLIRKKGEYSRLNKGLEDEAI